MSDDPKQPAQEDKKIEEKQEEFNGLKALSLPAMVIGKKAENALTSNDADSIIAVDRCKHHPFSEAMHDYIKRTPWNISLIEVAEKKSLPDAQLREKEADLLLQAVPKGAKIIALDERGKLLNSEKFAHQLGTWRDEGNPPLAFLIGGATGHAEKIRQQADLSLSLSSMTWPHLMVRMLLSEQLYRAHCILSSHPYHK